ncbi:UDP-glucose/GDP-mannose dehydrogenase family protein [Streptomyces platensis]|nr:UDP-glucose/GDP-mannose dehydrogenase family protein [Streptomyces platensis]
MRPADAAPWKATARHSTPAETMLGADAAIVVTEWPELKTVDWSAAGRCMRRRLLFDGRNVLDPHAMASAGFTYMSVGRATVLPNVK